jgi:estrone sulfotransferase
MPRELRKFLESRMVSIGILKDRWLPDPLFDDDIFIVSYPRSGNTWLRFLIANLLFPNDIVDFQTISKYIPAGARVADRIWQAGESKSRPRYLKQHSLYHPKYPRVIYLVRDGRDVYISYYEFLRNSLAEQSLVEFIGREDLPYGSWSQHIRSWMSAGLPPNRFLLIKYEDMLANTDEILRRIAKFSGLYWSEDEVNLAIQKSSFNNMREIEETKGFPKENKFAGSFIRKGKSGTWHDVFGSKEKEVFKRFHNSALVSLGYELDDTW